ncbi:MAG: 4Fe-4S binding protein [Actinomycetota bacterium]|nr:4Fe-4S binding protein [Actinomycetota bacterium]
MSTLVMSHPEACTSCGLCVITCPTNALRPAPLRPLLDLSLCNGCLECLEVCPRDVFAEG